MTSGSTEPPSIGENLRAAICLLAFITQRPPDVEELLPRNEKSGDQDDENLPTDTAVSDVDADFEDPAEDLDVIDADEGVDDEQLDLAVLRDRVLDRLAETLARFKSDPGGNRGSRLGSRHVSSSMMIVYHQSTRVKFLCAKNQGLNQRGTSEDTDFLDSWKECMECISKTGPAAEEAKASLFALVLDYQRPRINHYLKMLQDAFAADTDPKLPPHSNKAELSEIWLRRLHSVRSRTWVDDNGNEFNIGVNQSAGVDAESEAALTGDSLRNINDEVDAIFDKIDRLCQFNVADDDTTRFTDSQKSLLKELMAVTVGFWKSVRHQSAIKTRLRNQFWNARQRLKRQKAVTMALKFLCRVYLGVVTFIEAAEKMPMFRSIEYDPVKVPPQESRHGPLQETPMEVTKRLGIRVTGDGWVDRLQQPATKRDFNKLRKEKRYMHAELQVLYDHDAFYTDRNESFYVLCIYGHLTRIFKSGIIRIGPDGGNLGDIVEAWAVGHRDGNKDASSGCDCIPWFLERRPTGFDIPNWEGQYVYQVLGVRVAEQAFSLRPAAEDPTPLSLAESAVLSLYTRLYRPFNNVPDVYSSEWANFGICFCTSSDQRKSLANLYLEFAESGTPLGEMAHALMTSSLSQLMKARGMDLSFFEAKGICFRRPDVDEFGIYRLMAEVSHTVSGRFCDCFRPKGHCHPRHETHLSHESDGDYGFHGTNAWERWQLLNFYYHVFQHPSFDAQRMQQAKRQPDHNILEEYLNSLVPNFRLKIGNMYLADAMFPKLRGRIQFPHGRPHCYCVVHDVLTSEGLDWRIPWRIQDSFMPEDSRETKGNGAGDNS